MSLPADYFDRLYAADPDPWGFRTRWYERRKRDLTLAALDRPRYAAAFEPGCSVGELTRALADRCDRVLATDVSEPAVTAARQRLAGLDHVIVEQRAVPGDWPAGDFDLVVLSEIGYYLDRRDLAELARRSVAALRPGGALLACHWRHPVADYPLRGDDVHAELARQAELVRRVRHEEQDVLLELWTRGESPSPARREGLV